MGSKAILYITLKRKKVMEFLLNSPYLSSNIINLCLGYIDALAKERDLLIKQEENTTLFS